MPKPSVYLISLGCAKNLVDSEVMLGLLASAHYPLVSSPKQADLLIINTCSFIQEAREEAVETILEMAGEKKARPAKCLIVSGCLPQRYKHVLPELLPEVDAFVGTESFPRIVEIIENLDLGRGGRFYLDKTRYLYDHTIPRINTSSPGSAYIKIAEGCSHGCTFCTIPRIRGPFRSRQPESIVQEAHNLARQSVREINLVSQDSSLYGRGLDRSASLAELLRQLVCVEGIEWVRVLYLSPQNINDELLEVFRNEDKVCSYFDIPIQHCNKEILAAMNRPYDAHYLIDLINNIRNTVPDATIRTTLLVGFPGEASQQFFELETFVREMEFDRLGVFTYSQEEGTAAERLAHRIPEGVLQERRHRILSLQAEISQRKNRALEGAIRRVLVENVSNEGAVGRTAGQAPEVDGVTHVHSRTPVIEGHIYTIRITGSDVYDLTGEVVSAPEENSS